MFEGCWFDWSEEKNRKLKAERKIGFENVLMAIREGRTLAIWDHDNPKYGHQMLLVVEIEKYAYVVPFVKEEEKIFFKTIYPSRKMTRLLIEGMQ
jgi:hypothetical protein